MKIDKIFDELKAKLVIIISENYFAKKYTEADEAELIEENAEELRNNLDEIETKLKKLQDLPKNLKKANVDKFNELNNKKKPIEQKLQLIEGLNIKMEKWNNALEETTWEYKNFDRIAEEIKDMLK